MVVGLLWMGGILIAVGWFAIGWVARGQENRKYAESRLRYFVDQAIHDQRELLDSRAWWDSDRLPRETPTVVNVYVAAPPVPAWSPPPVIDAQVVPALPAGRGAQDDEARGV
jgi:hypothetical protein